MSRRLLTALGPAVILAVAALVLAGRLAPAAAVPAHSPVVHSRTLGWLVPARAVEVAARARRTDALAIGGVAFIVTLALGVLLSLRPTRVERSVAVDAPSTAADRERLVATMIEVADAVTSDGLRRRLGDALRDAGVVPVACADGDAFDGRRHHAVERVATTDARLDGRIAGVARAGYTDQGITLRHPDVLVYATEPTHV